METTEMNMAKKIASRRRELKLTLEDIGKIVGVSKSTVKKWETGYIANMKRDKIAKLASALQCTPSHLMGWKDAVSDEFSKEETKIINDYRLLNAQGRECVRNFMYMAVSVYIKKIMVFPAWKTPV